MSETPRLSVAIVNWNTRDLLLRCLASLRQAAGQLDMEIIVVDNGSHDGSVPAVQDQYPEVVLIANPESRGFAAGTNQALSRARAPVWALVAPDAEMKPGALSRLYGELTGEPGLMAVGPQLLNTDGSLQPSGRRFPTLGRMFWEGLLPEKIKQTKWWQRQVFGRVDFTQPTDVDEVSGACLLARREAFERIGLLDEQFFIYYEEVDWFLRLAREGGKVRYQPAAQVYHHWGAGMAQMKGEGVLIHYRSAFRFWRKHRGWCGELAARVITLFHSQYWMIGRFILTALFIRPWKNLAGRLALYFKIFFLAGGWRR